jgi:hypothetical protein
MLKKGIDVSANKLRLVINGTLQESDVMIVNGYSLQGTFPILLIFHMKRLF